MPQLLLDHAQVLHQHLVVDMGLSMKLVMALFVACGPSLLLLLAVDTAHLLALLVSASEQQEEWVELKFEAEVMQQELVPLLALVDNLLR
jgi:hypothetical protein